jgi:hypothetical protein
MIVPVLRRRLDEARPAERPLYRAALAHYAGLGRTALRYGAHAGMPAARRALRILRRAAPGAPGPWLWWLASFAPRRLRARWTGPDVVPDGALWTLPR